MKQYEIVATLDSKTSKICQEMDGKQFDVDSYQKVRTAHPSQSRAARRQRR